MKVKIHFKLLNDIRGSVLKSWVDLLLVNYKILPFSS